jgi:hypothetical protein
MIRPHLLTPGLCASLAFLPPHSAAEPPAASQTLPEVVVEGKADSLLSEAPAASKGQTSAAEIMARPVLRRGELLESVPGVIITQHSGDGKANQYFLRGFNLDHGTDFGVFLEGMPVNMRTHAHGQGYADLNPIIPEMVEELDYRKGPYFAPFGDLTAAGSARFRLWDALPHNMASLSVGENGYYRGLLAGTIRLSDPIPATSAPTGKDTKMPQTIAPSGVSRFLTYGLEYSTYDGPWELAQDSRRWNGVLRYVHQDVDSKLAVTAMGYDGRWRSTDQIPLRAVQSGLIGRFGNLDDSDRGASSRYSLLIDYDRKTADGGGWHVDAWGGYYDLGLYSNFTYFLDDPVRGDQFEQSEERWQAGATVRRDWKFDLGSATEQSRFTAGLETRHDWIGDIGLYKTTGTQRHATVRQDDVYESSAGVFAEAELRVNDWLRITPGVRADAFRFDVTSDNAANTGTDNAGLVSPKLSIVLGPWQDTEIYVNAGYGFHSNDARGVLTRMDPVSGDPVDTVDPLVRVRGAELGVRTEASDHWVHTVSLWCLESDSELVYVGDAGTNEAGPSSSRYGVEISSYWRPGDWFTFDSEFSLAHARFEDTTDDHIPGSVPFSWSGGITLGREEGWFGALRGRYFAPRPLEETGRIESKSSFQVNARIGYRKNDWEVALDCLNVLDRDDNDIEYYYTSRLPGEGVDGVDDIHFHPAEPRTFRITLTKRF